MAASVYPWSAPVHYFAEPRPNQAVDQMGLWFRGTWIRQNVYRNGSTTPETIVNRQFESGKRVSTIREERSGGAASRARTLLFKYDGKKRLVSLVDEAVGQKHSFACRYGSTGRLVEEATEKFGPGTDHVKTVARHKRTSNGTRIQVLVNGLLREELAYNAKDLASESTFYSGDPPAIWFHELTEYNSRRQPTKRTTKRFGAVDPGKPWLLLEDNLQTYVYSGGREKSSRIVENSLVGNVMHVTREWTSENDVTTADVRAIRMEDRNFGLTQAGTYMELLRLTQSWSYDAQGNIVEETESGTNFETGVSRTNVAKTVREDNGRRIRRLLDLGNDGSVDEEELTVLDDQNRVIESRSGKPDGGPFTSRRVMIYSANGELQRLELYRDNSAVPVIAHEYLFT